MTSVEGKLNSTRWENTVKVYADVSDLGSLPKAKAREMFALSLAQWSSDPTSTLRASIVSTFDDLGPGDD